MTKRTLIKFIRYFGYVLILVFLVMSIQANARQRRNIDATRAIADQLVANNKIRDANVQKLLDSNDQQTLILCTIILANSQALSTDEVSKIEEICKQKIQQLTKPHTITQTPTTPSSANQTITTVTTQNTPVQSSPQTIETPVGTISLCLPFTGVCVR